MMACLNMLSNEQQAGVCAAMGPRISFSNDFADCQHPMMRQQDYSYKEAPVSSDNFEFSVSGYSMISADEVFCKGKLMPLKDRSCGKTTTLRDELLQANNDDDYGDLFPCRMPKGMSRWRERLGLKRSHIFPRKADKNLERIDETKVPDLINEHVCCSATSQQKN